MGITVRELITKLSVDGDKAIDDLSRFGLAVNGAKAALGLLTQGFDAARQIAFGFVAEQTKAADEIAKTARSMGMQATELQRLIFAGEQAGVPMQNLIKSSQNLARNLRDAAAGGGKPFVLALKQMGLKTKDLIGLKYEDQLAKIGEGLRTLPGDQMRLATSARVLGEEAGPKFASFLKLSTDEIKALGNEAERLGFIIGDDGLKAAEDYQDTLNKLSNTAKGLKRAIGVEVAPAIEKTVKRINEWLIANRKMIRQKTKQFLLAVANVVEQVIDNFEKWASDLSDFVRLAGRAIGIFRDMVDGVGGLENALKLAAIAWTVYKVAQATALGPLGLALIAVTGLAAAFLDVESNADKASRAQKDFGQKEFLGSGRVSDGRRESLISRFLEQGDQSRQQAGVGEDLLFDLSMLSGSDLTEIFDRVNSQRLLKHGKAREDFVRFVRATRHQVSTVIGMAKEDERKEELAKEKAHAKKRADASAEEMRKAYAKLRRLANTQKGGDGPGSIGDAELFKLIDVAASQGRSLTGLIGTRKIEGGTPPVVAVKIIKTTVTKQIDAPITVTGVPGEGAEELSDRVLEGVREIWRGEVEEALEELTPAFGR